MKCLQLLAALTLGLAPACVSSKEAPEGSSTLDYGVGGERSPTVRTMHSMARVLAAQGRDGQCELVLRRLIGEHPDFMPAYVELAELLMRLGRTYDASDVLAAGVARNPNDAVVRNDLGMTLLIGGDPASALEHFSAAAALDPQDARSLANRAAALGLLGRYEEALEAYLDIVPAADAHHNLGILAQANGDDVRAAREFAAGQALEDGDQAAAREGSGSQRADLH